MKHPFEITEINEEQIENVAGGMTDFLEIRLKEDPPPVFYTMAIGEDGGEVPAPIFM